MTNPANVTYNTTDPAPRTAGVAYAQNADDSVKKLNEALPHDLKAWGSNITAAANIVSDADEGSSVSLTAQTFTLTGSSGGGTIVAVTKSLSLRGRDKVFSKIKAGPSDTSGTLSLLVVSEGKRLVLRDLNLEGPDTDVNLKTPAAVLAGSTNQNTACTVEAQDCTLTKWGVGIKMQGADASYTGAHKVVLERTDITGRGEDPCVLVEIGGELHARGCVFDMERTLFLSAAATATATGVTITDATLGFTFTADTATGSKELHNVSTFSSASVGTIQLGDSITGSGIPGGATVAAQPVHNLYLYQNVSLSLQDCTFLNAGGYNIQYHSAGVPTTFAKFARIAGCSFLGSPGSAAILANGYKPTVISDSVFSNTSGAGINCQAGDVVLDACNFLSGNGYPAIQTLSGWAAPPLRATDCYFTTYINYNLTGDDWRFVNCRWQPGDTNAPIVVRASGRVFVTGGHIQKGSRVADGLVIATGGTANLERVKIDNGTLIAVSVTGGTALVDRCTFQDDTKAVSNTSGNLVAVVPAQGVSPNAVASGASIVLPLNYNTTHITGTAAIANIYVQDTTTAKNALQVGPVHLIFDAAATLTTAGNIAETLNAVAGRMYTFTKDWTTGKWYRTS